MKELIGFNMIAFAISLLITWGIGWDSDTEEKLIFTIGEPLILGILSVGIYLMV